MAESFYDVQTVVASDVTCDRAEATHFIVIEKSRTQLLEAVWRFLDEEIAYYRTLGRSGDLIASATLK